MHHDGDVPELKDWDEIYSIKYPAGVSLWLSGNPWDLLQDFEVHSLHTTSGSVPEGINSSSFFNDCQDIHEGILAAWKETLKLILLFLPFSAQLLIHKPSPNRPIWHLVASSPTPSPLDSEDGLRRDSGGFPLCLRFRFACPSFSVSGTLFLFIPTAFLTTSATFSFKRSC